VIVPGDRTSLLRHPASRAASPPECRH
jgi:hypothetical protein